MLAQVRDWSLRRVGSLLPCRAPYRRRSLVEPVGYWEVRSPWTPSPFSRDDHKTVEQLFKRFEKAGDEAYVEKRQIVDRIIEELSVHAAIEEQVFYPVARATVADTEDIALESLEEHHIVKWVLSELDDLDPADERFDAKVTVLIENVRHHVEEEEDEFFPKVAQSQPHAARRPRRGIGEAKKTAPTHPHPRSPDTPPGNSVAGTDCRRHRPRRRQHQRHGARGSDGGARPDRSNPQHEQAEGDADRHDCCAHDRNACSSFRSGRSRWVESTARSAKVGATKTFAQQRPLERRAR